MMVRRLQVNNDHCCKNVRVDAFVHHGKQMLKVQVIKSVFFG